MVRWLSTALLLASVAAARAQPAQELRPPRKQITAARAQGAIAIDGVLDDPTWRAATWTTDFVEKEPTYGAPPAHPIAVAIAYDDDAIYVAARLDAAGPDDVDGGLTRRDDDTEAERFIVSLDPFRSHHVAYSFAVTAAGVRLDWIHTDDDEMARDSSWDPVWQAATRARADGWDAELRIPLGQLRYPAGDDTWGVDFNRYVPHRQEDIFWIAVPRELRAWSSWFGALRFAAPPAPARHLELVPYASAGIDLIETPSGQLPSRARAIGNAGLDLRLGLGPSLTLTATINPDFGQVEADPAIVNLTAYEVTLPERRPFFIEGSQIFATGHGYFYSRRIGGLPALDLTYDELAPPAAARILGAAKLSGALTPHTNVGALAAITSAEDAPAIVGGTRTELALAPTTAWGVARVEHELDDAGGAAGATITGVARDLDDPTLVAQLARTAVTGGADVRVRPDHGAYELMLHAGGSLLTGTPTAITHIEEEPAHYFQRPDQPHVHLDATATSLAGWHSDAAVRKRAGAWLFDTGFAAESPGLDLNDAGVLSSADDLDWYATGTRQETTPSDHLHAWRLTLGSSGGWNFGGVRKSGDVYLDSSFTLPSFASTGGALWLHYPGLLDDLTRGGPLMRDGAGASATWFAKSTPNRTNVWSVNAAATWSQTAARGATGNVSLTTLASPQLRLQITPRFVWQDTALQYVDTIVDPSAAATFGSRYLFARLDRRELAAQIRAQLALTPDLALDVYVEPFVSIGRYTGLGELAAPRTSDLRRYADAVRDAGTITVTDGGRAFSLDDPDFTTASLRSTVVLRWEIRPGSILYAVWQQNRYSSATAIAPTYRAIGQPFTAPGEHVVAVKLSWWFAP